MAARPLNLSCHAFPVSQEGQTPARLLLKVQLQIPLGPVLDLTALVDTGAEVNIIRRGLVPDIHFTPSFQPVRFLAANQTFLALAEQT